METDIPNNIKRNLAPFVLIRVENARQLNNSISELKGYDLTRLWETEERYQIG